MIVPGGRMDSFVAWEGAGRSNLCGRDPSREMRGWARMPGRMRRRRNGCNESAMKESATGEKEDEEDGDEEEKEE